MQQHTDQGNAEALRYLGTPGWAISAIFKARSVIFFGAALHSGQPAEVDENIAFEYAV